MPSLISIPKKSLSWKDSVSITVPLVCAMNLDENIDLNFGIPDSILLQLQRAEMTGTKELTMNSDRMLTFP